MIMVTSGISVNSVDKGGRAPIHLAAENGHADIIKLLLAHHAQIDETDSRGWTPLHYSIENRHYSAVQLLLNHGADVNKDIDKSPPGRVSPLLRAARKDMSIS